jgi:hypothetical protein
VKWAQCIVNYTGCLALIAEAVKFAASKDTALSWFSPHWAANGHGVAKSAVANSSFANAIFDERSASPPSRLFSLYNPAQPL